MVLEWVNLNNNIRLNALFKLNDQYNFDLDDGLEGWSFLKLYKVKCSDHQNDAHEDVQQTFVDFLTLAWKSPEHGLWKVGLDPSLMVEK